MKLSLTSILVLSLLFCGLLFTDGCSVDPDAASGIEASSDVSVPASTIEITDARLNPQDFKITENAEGVPIITGNLSNGVTLNARLYCERDLAELGTASIDSAKLRVFEPKDLDSLLQDSWTISTDTVDTFERNGVTLAYRTVLYEDGNQHRGSAINTDCSIAIKQDGLAAPVREPWFSEDFIWQSEDFSFATPADAFEMLRELADSCGVQLSSVYQIDRVPSETLEAFYRLRISYGETLPEMEWARDYNAYSITMTQDWNGLPVNPSDLFITFDGTSLEGESSRIMNGSKMSGMVTADGVQNMQIYNVYEPVSQGKEQVIVSFWEALSVFRKHIDQPQYELETFYQLSEDPQRNLTIDQIELCYVPIWQGDIGSADPAPYDMIPCWTFRVVGYEKDGAVRIFSGVVNAISGEYILQTSNISST